MIKEAVNKIKGEISKDKNPYVKIVGEFLLKYLEINPSSAEKILREDKTIAKSLDAMKEAARKKIYGGYAMLTDQEGFEIVLKYFDIKGQVPLTPVEPIEVKVAPEVKPVGKDIDFDVSLDDFI